MSDTTDQRSREVAPTIHWPWTGNAENLDIDRGHIADILEQEK